MFVQMEVNHGGLAIVTECGMSGKSPHKDGSQLPAHLGYKKIC